MSTQGLGILALPRGALLSPGELQTSSPVTQAPAFTRTRACYANIHCHGVTSICIRVGNMFIYRALCTLNEIVWSSIAQISHLHAIRDI